MFTLKDRSNDLETHIKGLVRLYKANQKILDEIENDDDPDGNMEQFQVVKGNIVDLLDKLKDDLREYRRSFPCLLLQGHPVRPLTVARRTSWRLTPVYFGGPRLTS